ncbi:MAG: DUF1553 domain-containing protein [Planctomycetes bacterium]|nr:DUF1553 domain-containing protein [Planctomycetota bacterium]
MSTIRLPSLTATVSLLLIATWPGILPRGAAQSPALPSTRIDFNRQVRPILSEHCFRCHGPDDEERKAKLRLDTRAGMFGKLRGGEHAVVPGDIAKSALLARITESDASRRMPPPRFKKDLSREQIDILRRWIEQGADWSEHWSFVPPRRPLLPMVKRAGWSRNAVDAFILARLEREGMSPSPEAERATLIRRLSLDLTGLPPTPAEVDDFLADKSAAAYEKVVDRLLDSPHFGERMALDWLDAARYADTHGYHIDAGRDMTAWRDWVIDAFNQNLPFDQFTLEQLAGDLLPDATQEQKIASGFNRNHMINFEGGAIPKEYHAAYIVDRVNTTATVWLGLTVACAQCHDHKYDPISQKEFYQLYAFFHNVPENGLDGSKGNAAPLIKAPSKKVSRALQDLQRRIDKLARQPDSAKELAKLRQEQAQLEKTARTAMVMAELAEPRDTFVMLRGQYDKLGEQVRAATPAALPPFPAGAPGNRLGLARWLIDPQHPLTARVAVNRYWQMIFGTGLVRSSEDFGSQGERPSHPELLDWLASEFTSPSLGDRSWDVKRLIRLLVTSATYRQSSRMDQASLARDPENRLLGRSARLRLQAEFLRDHALSVSGLLNREIGGASVFPSQPAGLWQELASRTDSKNWSAQFFTQSRGKDLYRRGMYTFWKRTSPPPQMITFDAPDRETCTVRRSRTNTPLQALVLLNDPTFVEASRHFAERLLREAKTTDERVILAFRLATARRPNDRELAIVGTALVKQRQIFERDPRAAEKLLNVGEAPRDPRWPAAELAAWTMVASMILNLDESLTRG